MSETVEQRAIRWLVGHDTGLSSKSILRHMMGLGQDPTSGASAPLDGADLGRCLRLLSLIPEWEGRITEMAALGNGWAALVPHWNELKQMAIEETGPAFSRNCSTPRTSKRIREIQKP